MTYKLNGTELTLQPTTGRWLPREELGIDGNGHIMYEPTSSFRLSWQNISVSDFEQINTFFDTQGKTGTSVVDLPQWGASSYTFYAYTGCVINEPEVDVYFSENMLNASLIVRRVRT